MSFTGGKRESDSGSPPQERQQRPAAPPVDRNDFDDEDESDIPF
jgi:hypothetical protein